MKFDKELCKEAESRLNQVLFEAEVKRLIRQEVDKCISASRTTPVVKLQFIANLKEEQTVRTLTS